MLCLVSFHDQACYVTGHSEYSVPIPLEPLYWWVLPSCLRLCCCCCCHLMPVGCTVGGVLAVPCDSALWAVSSLSPCDSDADVSSPTVRLLAPWLVLSLSQQGLSWQNCGRLALRFFPKSWFLSKMVFIFEICEHLNPFNFFFLVTTGFCYFIFKPPFH